MKKALTLLLAVFSVIHSQAQHGQSAGTIKSLIFGIKAGAAYTNISDLSKVIVSESYYTGYTFEEKPGFNFTGGVFINYKFEGSISALYTEVSYSRLSQTLKYSDVNDFNYDLTLRYDYINLDFCYKAYVFRGMHLGIGPRAGFILTPGGLYYTSNGEDQFGPDLRIQQQLRDVLRGRNTFSLGVIAGYEFPFGLSIDARFYYGLSDVMKTEINNFNFIETHNSSRVVQITLGYAIPYDFF
jgi:hypothetical protein